jgi:serpin B
MYLENGDFQAVRLPYGEGLVSMYVYLPKPESSLPKLLGQLTASNWETWLPKFNVRKGAVVLPRFKSEYQADLVMLLTALGMGIAFDGDKADFTGMQQNSKLYINRVVHKALVQVDEKGTEAAAVTVVGAAPASAMPPPPFNFVADRPFFYAIVDHQTGMPLFMGTVVAPQT